MSRLSVLAIILNLGAGLLLTSYSLKDRVDFFKQIHLLFAGDFFRFVFGIVVFMTGFFKLFLCHGPVIIGDLLFSLSGMAGGLSLFFEFYQTKLTETGGKSNPIGAFFLEYKLLWGCAVLCATTIHFMFYPAWFV